MYGTFRLLLMMMHTARPTQRGRNNLHGKDKVFNLNRKRCKALFYAPILGTGPYIFCTCTKEQTEK
ncbi:MAG: hypothetical protein D8H98_16535 [Prevotella sp.]|nr:MAG: hypothetical protein D8H98_16535 [Prevotella sp.]